MLPCMPRPWPRCRSCPTGGPSSVSVSAPASRIWACAIPGRCRRCARPSLRCAGCWRARRSRSTGDTLTVDGGRLVRPPAVPVPVAIGTRSPGVMRLAGEVADTALVGARHLTPEIVARYRTWIAEGAARVGRDVCDDRGAPAGHVVRVRRRGTGRRERQAFRSPLPVDPRRQRTTGRSRPPCRHRRHARRCHRAGTSTSSATTHPRCWR